MLSQESHRDHSMATKRDPNRRSSHCIRWKKKTHLGSSWTYQLLLRVLLHGGFELQVAHPMNSGKVSQRSLAWSLLGGEVP